MSEDKHRETLSALMDGETSELDSRRLLRDLDSEAAGRWSRWHLARDLMQGHDAAPAPQGFAASVCAGLDGEARERGNGWLLQASRVGIAASVAMAMVLGWQYYDAGDSSATPQVAQGDARMSRLFTGAELVGREFAGNPAQAPADGVSVGQVVEPRIEHLMVRHSDFAARQGGQGPVPYVRFISMDANKGEQ